MTASSSPLKVAGVVGVVVAVAAGIAVVSLRSALRNAAAAPPSSPAMTAEEMADVVKDMRVAPFEGMGHRGEPVDASVFQGHWTVVSFGFTHCTLVCPTLHREIYRMGQSLADRGVRFVTFSVDPEHDTIAQMADHVAAWGVARDAWTFVKVDSDALAAILAGLSMPGVSEDTSQPITLPGGGTMSNILHTSRFFVVGPDGRVRGLWRGSDPTDVDAMIGWLMVNAR